MATHTFCSHDRSYVLLRCITIAFAMSMMVIVPARSQQVTRRVHPSDSLGYVAIELIDNGRIEPARQLLREGIRLYPDVSTFPYELAYIHYQLKEYRQAREILDTLIDKPDATDRFFQLLGNVRDFLGDSKLAIRTYDSGLERFPNSGPLHLERGLMAAMGEDYLGALALWERGIHRAPDFASNYYYVSRVLASSLERGWAMLYGEIFLNIEPASERSGIARSVVYNAWNEAISVASDGKAMEIGKSTVNVGLFEKIVVEIDTASSMTMMPFQFYLLRCFVMAAMPSIAEGDTSFSIAELHAMRLGIVERWFEDTAAAKRIDLEFFDRLRTLRDAGLFEAYDYMLFQCPATSAEVDAWAASDPGNPTRMRQVSTWLRENPIGLDSARALCRLTVRGVPMPKSEADSLSKFDVDTEP